MAHMIKHKERHYSSEIYEYTCDVDGCKSRQEFDIDNRRKVKDWNVARMFVDGVVKESHYVCPKCQS